MGYFSNGAEGDFYQEAYCARCVHNEGGCAVWLAHMLHNYAECNNPNSILHILIPTEGISNKQCLMFFKSERDPRQQDMFAPNSET